MELNEALALIESTQKKLFAFGAASSALYLDAVTVAPRDTAEGRGVALGVLAGEQHKILTDPVLADALAVLEAHKGELDRLHARETEELGRSVRQLTRIPAEEYMAYAQLASQAGDVWKRSKEQSDFQLFRPYLEKLVDYNRRFAGYYDPAKAPYDALLNEYERGVDTAYLDGFFAEMREKLVPLIKAVGEKPQPDDGFLHRHYPVEQQKKYATVEDLGRYLRDETYALSLQK